MSDTGVKMKFISWNIDSLNAALTGTSARAQMSAAVLEKIAEMRPDYFAIQETKLPEAGPNKKQMEVMEQLFRDYDYHYVSSRPPARKGYAGVMVFVRRDSRPVLEVTKPSIGAPDTMDVEGRILTIETERFFFTIVYTPNAGDGLRRLDDRQLWDARYADYLAELDAKKPVIACGDYNVAHEEIDLKNPAANHMSAGFTDQEREGFTRLLGCGFADSFRRLHQDLSDAYSWWAQRVKSSKINNSGWRIDYFLVSERILDKVLSSEMVDSGARQDHCPILLEIDI